MSYQVLARKWRPRNFETLVGQEHVVRALVHALSVQRLHHAYLFTGTRGVGKTTIARILAKSLNCEQGVTASPCGTCSSCSEIDQGRFVDLLEVDAATNTKVDEMRQLLENAIYAPTRGRFKVYVIDEVHMLSNAAFNAMLKTLEEPPEHVKFILATTDPQKIPVTVLSRCMQFNLKQMAQASIRQHLAHVLNVEAVSFDEEALGLLAKAARGSMRDALSLLDQAIAHGSGSVAGEGVRLMLGSVGDEHLGQIFQALVDKDSDQLGVLAQDMADRSLSFDDTLASMAEWIVQAQYQQMTGAPQENGVAFGPADLADALSSEYLQLAYEICLRGREQLPWAPEPQLGFLMTLLRLLAFFPRELEGTQGLNRQGQKKNSARSNRREAIGHTRVESVKSEEATLGRSQNAIDLVEADSAPASSAGASTQFPQWDDIVGRLNLSGLARETAQHCELAAQQGDTLSLRLAPEHRHLLSAAVQEKIEASLAEFVGHAVQVQIELAALKRESPAAGRARMQSERLAEAVAAIEADPTVRELIELLDASVVEGSVRAID